jgi:hypothetical protein
LLVASAEWVQSVHSCRFRLHENELIAPNRDYPYEGLLVYQDGENWKIIDCIAIGVRSEAGRALPFDDPTTDSVRLNPWETTYQYRIVETDEEGRKQAIPFLVSYRLFSACPPDMAAGRLTIRFPNGAHLGTRRLHVIVQPLLDIRHMFGGSDLGRYRTECLTSVVTRIHVSNADRTITFSCPSAKANRFTWPEAVPWWYKLGCGERAESNGATRLIGERREIGALFNLELDITGQHSSATVYFSCSVEGRGRSLSIAEFRQLGAASLHHDRAQLASLRRLIPTTRCDSRFVSSVLGRMVGLTKFRIHVHSPSGRDSLAVPCAGAWWFKTAWYRDVFEGILSSFDVLMGLDGEREMIRNVLHLAVSQQDRATGRVPNRIAEFKGLEPAYNSADATPLFFIVGHRYVCRTQDVELARNLLRAAGYTLRGFQHNAEAVEDGPPRVDGPTGLLLVAPQHSWMDTRAQSLDYAGHRLERLPSRLSTRFIKDLCDEMGSGKAARALPAPLFLLPEINAQWILALRSMLAVVDLVAAAERVDSATGHRLAQLRGQAQSLLARAESSYLPVFWNEGAGFLFNAVFHNLASKDPMESEACVAAAALLGESLFTRQQLTRIWHRTAGTLLIERYSGGAPQPFGIFAANADRRIFYGDAEYHADVVWPRSTPYLLKLLEVLGEKETIHQLLLSNLEHQMTEGAVFYNHEVLARPCGNNDRPVKSTCRDPVPVKNPIQFWSQWCDPFLTYLQEATHGNSDARIRGH